MAGSRPGAGHMPGVQNNQMGFHQQRAPIYDKQPVERISPSTNDNVADKFTAVIQDNVKLQGEIKQIQKLTQEKLTETKQKLNEANLEKEKLKAELKEYEVKLVSASQDYENAKVVVLTYKTRNIHLEAAALELEYKTAEVEKLTKEVEPLRKANMKNIELSENLRYAEDTASKAQRQVNQLQQTLRARSEQIDKLDMVMRSIAEQSQLAPDRLQWMMDEAWRQQQQSRQSLLQECDQLKATVHEKDMLLSQLQHQINELEIKKVEAETFRRIRGKNISTEKKESLAAKLDNATICIDKMNQEIEGYKADVKKKDAAIKGLQEILKKEQQSRQEKLALQEDHNAQSQQKIHELTRMNEKMHKKIEELNQKCEKAEMDYAILKSVDLNAREELQKYKEKVISLEHDIRKNKQIEADLYKELDGALKDLENVSKRYRSLQNENTELKRLQSVSTFTGIDDSQLVQELNHKNTQIEIMHGEIKRYADSLEKERRKVSLLAMDNQSYQHQLQHQLQDPPPLPPRSPNFSSVNKTQPLVNTHSRTWEGGSSAMVLSRDVGPSQIMPEHIAVEPNYYPERYMQYDHNTGRGQYPFKTHPQERSRTTPQFNSDPGLSEPCPLCNRRFATTEELTLHAARCNAHK